MKALHLTSTGPFGPDGVQLTMVDVPRPVPADDEVLLKVRTCGVCHTELDEIEGRTPPPTLPVIPGHQVVGTIESVPKTARHLSPGQRAGVAWIFSACGTCAYCSTGRENLCPQFRGTGRDANGGYAEYMTVPAGFVHTIPDTFSDTEAAPLLCAGAVGYRALKLAGLSDGEPLGLTGFGASGHLVLRLARHLYPSSEVFVFARSEEERTFAIGIGAAWAGDTRADPPRTLSAVIDTTPVWLPVLEALRILSPGGRLIINAIRKEASDQQELLNLQYARHLWMERTIRSVANVTRNDVREFLDLAAQASIRPETQLFTLQEANTALLELKQRNIRGAKVLQIS